METPLEGREGFATAPISRGHDPASLEYQVLLIGKANDRKVIGLYMDDTIIVNPEFGGRGLGTELVLRCVKHRPVPSKRTVTPIGKATLLRAHRIGVQRAIDAGLPVPAHVRAEYGF
jgi:hypothetical protein